MRQVLGSLKVWLRRRSFVANSVTLAGGIALGQALVVLTSPLLTRLYSPEDFGVLAVYASILSILVVMASLRYELAIPLAKDEENATNLLALSVFVALTTSLLCGLGIWLLDEQFVRWIGVPALEPYLLLLAPSLLGAGIYQALTYWTTRNKRYALLSYTKGLQAAGQVSIQVVGGLLALGPVGLIAGYLTSQFLGVGSLLRRSYLRLDAIAVGKWTKLTAVYKDFPLFTTWASFIGVIGIHAPAVLFARYFTLDVAGYFSLTMRVLGLPTTLVGQAVAQVFYATIAEKTNEDSNTTGFIEQLAAHLFVLSYTIFAIVGLHGPFLFAYVFGSDWKVGGLYAQYLAPWLVLSFVTSPLSTFTLVKGKQREGLLFDLCVTGLRIGSILLGARYSSPNLAVGLFSASGALIYIVYFAWILHLAGSSIVAWLRQVKVPVLVGLSLFLGLFLMNHLLHPIVALALSIAGLSLFNLWFWRRTHKGAGDE